MTTGGRGFSAQLGPADDDREPISPREMERPVHPAAARLIEEVRTSGEFTEDTWRRLSQAMDDLSDADLAAVLEEIGRSAVRQPTP